MFLSGTAMKIHLKFFLILLLSGMTSSVFAQWSNNPAVNNAICTLPGEEAIPKIATCPNGDTFIGYFASESGNYNVRLQRLDQLGNQLWAANGILISAHPQETWLTDWDMTCDAANHAILVFNDIRTGNTNVVAYRISPSGAFVWGNDGILLSNNSAFNAAPKVIATNSGNIVAAWSSDESIIMQKLNPAGTLQWGAAGITLSSSNTLSWPQLMPVGTDDFIMKYFEDSGPPYSPTRHVFARRFNSAGIPVWGTPATISTAGGISAWTQIFSMINDGSDGFYISWHDDRDNNQRASVFVQHISSSGAVLFAANGVEASNLSGMNHFYPSLALPQGSTDVYVFWNEMNDLQSQKGIFGQKINASGAVQWGSGGMTFIPVSSTNVLPYEVRSTPTDMVLFYEEYTTAVSGTIKAMRISPSGGFVWSPAQREVCSVSSEKIHAVINHFANNQWVLSWEDKRNGVSDIYAQNIQLDGSLGPAFSGTISGTITLNGGGGNVTQVIVQAGSTSTNPDPTGFYTMTVSTGTYTVSASLAGYQAASQSNVVVQQNQTSTVNLTLNPIPTGYIQGTVTLSGGFGIMTQVQVKAGTNTTSPDQYGNYTLIVSPGTYDVIATLPGYFPDTVNNISVANQQTVTGVNLLLIFAPTNGLISGTVTLAGGTGNVTQTVVSAGGAATTNPNAAGLYTLDLPAGNYDVTASLSGYNSQTITGVPVIVNQTTPNINFTLSPLPSSGTIQGTVVISGEPADVTQTLVTAGGYSVHPDPTGFYTITVPPGTYTVTATHPYTDPASVGNVVVTAGQTTAGINFNLVINRADMIVRAMEAQGGILNGVVVVIQGPGGPYSGTITNDSLIFPKIPYGFYQGEATFGGMYPTPSDTNINAGNHYLIFTMYISGIRENPGSAKANISPVPANTRSIVHFDIRQAGDYRLRLTDASGSTLAVRTTRFEKGSHQLPLSDLVSAASLTDGMYLLEIRDPSGLRVVIKFVFRN